LFGRRLGHKLSPAKLGRLETLLPRLRVPAGPLGDLKALFARPVDDVWLEIGFGGGEHLVLQAERNPGIGLIGCEPFINGAAKALQAIEERGLDNIRIHDGDAVDLLQRLPQASLDRAFLLYPDPWPKRRHNKRRFVSPERLDMLARALRPASEFRFASDIDDYVAWTLRATAASPDFDWPAECADDWRLPYDGWQPTRYEKKAIREGRRSSHLRFIRR
jgi:tRNA (guanine-N7-)-methyltransferase